ncbi:MAG: Ig-like domain-containing protein [Pseudomonadota bacterium]
MDEGDTLVERLEVTSLDGSASETIVVRLTKDTSVSLKFHGFGEGAGQNTAPELSFKAEVGAEIEVDWGTGEGFVAAGTATGLQQILTPPTPYASDGSYTVVLKVTDAAGNSAENSAELTLDTTPPAPPAITRILDDTGVEGDFITANAAVIVEGTAEPGSTVTLFADGAAIGDVIAGADGVWRVDLQASPLPEGTTNLTARARDGVGNTSDLSAAQSVTVDSSLTVALVALAERSRVDRDATRSADPQPSVQFSADAGATVEIDWGDGNGFRAFGEAIGALQSIEKSEAYATDGSKTVQLRISEGAGHVVNRTLTFDLDTTAPETPQIGGFSPDTGTAGDQVTSASEITIFGTGEPLSSIEIVSNNTVVGRGTVGADGRFEVAGIQQATVDTTLTFQARATDAFGNASGLSAPLAVTTDRTPPEGFAIIETGPFGSSDETPVLNILAETGSTISVDWGDGEGFTAPVPANGISTARQIEKSGGYPADGIFTITVRIADPAGNTTDRTVQYTFDGTPPTAPQITQIDNDTGTFGDGITNSKTFTLFGLAEPGTSVVVKEGTATLGTVQADASGSWQLAFPSFDRPDGAYSFTATASDNVGNESAPSAPFTLTLDTQTPTPVLNAITEGETIGSDRPTLHVAAETGAFLFVDWGDGAGQIPMGVAQGAPVTVTKPTSYTTDGDKHVVVRVQDVAGNASFQSINFTVDTTPPDAPTNLRLATASDSGAVGDGLPTSSRPRSRAPRSRAPPFSFSHAASAVRRLGAPPPPRRVSGALRWAMRPPLKATTPLARAASMRWAAALAMRPSTSRSTRPRLRSTQISATLSSLARLALRQTQHLRFHCSSSSARPMRSIGGMGTGLLRASRARLASRRLSPNRRTMSMTGQRSSRSALLMPLVTRAAAETHLR